MIGTISSVVFVGVYLVASMSIRQSTEIGQGSLRVFRPSVSGLIGEEKSSDRHAKENGGITATRVKGKGLKMKK